MKTIDIISKDIQKIIDPIWEHSAQMEAIANYIDQNYIKRELIDREIADKAKKWDELGEEIGKFYFDGEDESEDAGNLIDIGEITARKLGYL
jgi:hypothetical protein